MQGFCTECGQPFNVNGECPTGHPESAPEPLVLEPNQDGAFQPAPSLAAAQVVVQPVKPVQTLTPLRGVEAYLDLPKASTMRRLLGSGIEYLVYVTGIVMIAFLSLFTGGLIGLFAPLFLFGMVGLRDVNAGAFSISKRVGGLRVVDRETGLPPSNPKAVLRNSYYLILLLAMNLPYVEFVAPFFFFAMMFIDILMIMASPKGRRIGDLMANTQVVSEVQR